MMSQDGLQEFSCRHQRYGRSDQQQHRQHTYTEAVEQRRLSALLLTNQDKIQQRLVAAWRERKRKKDMHVVNEGI